MRIRISHNMSIRPLYIARRNSLDVCLVNTWALSRLIPPVPRCSTRDDGERQTVVILIVYRIDQQECTIAPHRLFLYMYYFLRTHSNPKEWRIKGRKRIKNGIRCPTYMYGGGPGRDSSLYYIDRRKGECLYSFP